ncbi:hypothetical protein GOV12_06150 [Candidatus Pacearchaeota archaeon]|nr:hypothetical protein [Candidatus Pacearchaeota archaeon]
MTKKKIIILVIVLLIWYMFLFFIRPSSCPIMKCVMPTTDCQDITEIHLFPQCHSCGCYSPTTILEILVEVLIIFFPSILVYIVWSLFERKKKK